MENFPCDPRGPEPSGSDVLFYCTSKRYICTYSIYIHTYYTLVCSARAIGGLVFVRLCLPKLSIHPEFPSHSQSPVSSDSEWSVPGKVPLGTAWLLSPRMFLQSGSGPWKTALPPTRVTASLTQSLPRLGFYLLPHIPVVGDFQRLLYRCFHS